MLPTWIIFGLTEVSLTTKWFISVQRKMSYVRTTQYLANKYNNNIPHWVLSFSLGVYVGK